MEKKIEFRKFRPLPDSCTPLSSFEDPTEPENKIEYLCSTSLINAETGEETGIPVYHLKRTYPADGVKDYWDKRLLEAARKQGKLIPNYKPNRKKLELLSWLHSWFSNIFDDTEGDEWMNSVILIGRLARDPELSYTPNTQTAACRITLAVDRPKRNGDAQGNGEYVRSADFIRVTVWGRQAETCDRYLAKGRQVAVHGRIQTGSYKNHNGETVYTTDVVADRVEFLGSSNQQAAAPTQANDFNALEHDESVGSVQASFDDLPDTFAAAEDDVPF